MKSNPLLFIIAAILIGIGAYWFFFANGAEQPSLTMNSTQNEAQAKFQALTSQLQSISFDTRIFSDPNFTSLVSLATSITPETKGTIDPFAPLR